MTDFRTVVALVCEATDDDSARRIIAALIEWTGPAALAVPTPRQDDTRPALNERRLLLRAELCERAEAGETLVQPRDFTAWVEDHGLSRPWLQGEFKRLTETGFLQRDAHGSYTILHSHRHPA
ncbi:hypothetical protein [Streptomyces antibioticus]|uniref:hypothetical protein n=1 Tax=Streptomyces antibioticus TaxID=1890 RepID=UPI00340E7FFD